MARLHIYAVRDHAVESFAAPICVRALGEALRAFFDECARPGSQFNLHPKDFELYQLAEYDDSDGRLIPLDIPRRVASGATWLKEREATAKEHGHVSQQVG